MADSTVTIVGNLTRDPEIRYTTGGAAKASFGVAVSRQVAEPPVPGMGRADELLQRRVLA